MVQIDPEGWLIKELDFEKPWSEHLFQLEQAGCVLGRLAAAPLSPRRGKDKTEALKALSAAWKREKAVRPAARSSCSWVRRRVFSAALLEAPGAPRPRSASQLSRDWPSSSTTTQTEALFRTAWANPREAYGAERPLCKDSSLGRSRTPINCSKSTEDSRRSSLDRRDCARAHLETPGPKARELAALYSRYGQPRTLRSTAIAAFGRLAKDDSSLQDILITLVDDPDRFVRFQAWGAVRELKLKKAAPALTARLGRRRPDSADSPAECSRKHSRY